ncbi:DoxX family protein [Polaribacter staleyi]|uniref:DoxX family protein n=1 Tax=Polaribacter staleyi TaxID=2022337 RepID=UPI0031BBC12F
MNRNTSIGLLILRITLGALMLLHGIAKLKGISYIKDMLRESSLPTVLAYGVYITEIIAPILVLIGFRTRLSAAVYAFGILFALFLVHLKEIFQLNKFGGWELELLGLYTFGAVALFFTGGGKIAVSSSHKWD